MTPAGSLPFFDPSFATPADWAALYRACALQVVPAHMPKAGTQWKRPALADWRQLQEELVPDATFERWYGLEGRYKAHQNLGVITGRASENLVVVDLDTHSNDQARLWWEGQLVINAYGSEPETWKQRTGGGGRQIFFRAPAAWHAPTNKTGLGVDIRGQGGFAMLPPSLHISGEEYGWEPGCAPWEADLAMAPEWLLAAVDALVEQYGGHKPGEAEGPQERTASPSSDFDPFWNRVDGREDNMRDRVWRAVLDFKRAGGEPGTPAEKDAFEAALMNYLRYTRTRIPGVDNVVGLERECRGPAAFYAKWVRAMRQWDGKVAIEAAKPNPKAKPENKSEDNSGAAFQEEPSASPPPPPRLAITKAFPIDGRAIERRAWIIPGLLIRRHLSVLVAPPGSGKSLLTLQLAIAMAAGISWGGFFTRQPSRVLVINAEDDLDEMRRRLWAAAQSMGVPQSDIADNLFLAENPEQIVVARTEPKSKAVIRTPLVPALIETIHDNQIDATIADPFAETFEGDENSNSEVKWAGIIWREIARTTNSAMLLVHHTRKYANGMAGDADASRGGGALIGTARVVSTLFGMTEDEAGVMGVGPDERTRYVRFDDAKANLSFVTGVAKWFRKNSMTIPNESISQPGDEVGVLAPWSPPGMFEGISNSTINKVLDVVDAGIRGDRGEPTGRLYTHFDNSADKSRWVGTVLMAHFVCDEIRAKRIVKEWLESGLLKVVEYDDGKQSRKGLRVDPAKRPTSGSF